MVIPSKQAHEGMNQCESKADQALRVAPSEFSPLGRGEMDLLLDFHEPDARDEQERSINPSRVMVQVIADRGLRALVARRPCLRPELASSPP